MLENCWQSVLVAGCWIVCSSLVPPAVQAQDDTSRGNIQLSPEKPEAAPMYSNQSGYANESSSRPFQAPQFGQYPRYQNYGAYPAQQQQYGEPYTRPGYYPSGSPDSEPAANFPQYESPQQQNCYQAGPTVPAGLVIPIDLRTAISTQVAKDGDFIEATVSQNIPLNGTGYLPAGSVVSGQVTESKAGRRLSRSGSLSIEFNNLRLPSGASFPMRAHLVGNIGRYKDVNGVERGEGWEAKLGQLALRGGGGAGLGAALGTGLGAICGGGSGAGTGAWAGAAFGGGLGAMDMLLRKGRDVIIPSGTEMKLQMEQPLTLPMSGSPQSY
ncbi:hypothetical protein BH10CYA1_BH10CYA1_07330 [soil metagenome]